MTPKSSPKSPEDEHHLELEKLKKDYEKLYEAKVRAEESLANLQERLESLKAQALQEYGISDPEALAERLEKERAENSRILSEYRAHLETIREELDSITKDFQGVDPETGDLGKGG